uniref:PTS system mannose/fructose/sorbose family transporter subunit IID n=1 Tax=Enorma massiliensis TaxID=1472761 RepID=UPI003A92B7C3
LRPSLGALGASLAMSGNIMGPILFFVAWNVIRLAFEWYTQEFGYQLGTSITKDLSGGLLGKITEGASILGMFVIGSLVERWVSISFAPVVSSVPLDEGAYIDPSALDALAQSDGVGNAVLKALGDQASGLALSPEKVTTLQQNLDSLIPGLAAVGVTLLCCWLLKKKVSPIAIIIGMFIVGIVGHYIGLL